MLPTGISEADLDDYVAYVDELLSACLDVAAFNQYMLQTFPNCFTVRGGLPSAKAMNRANLAAAIASANRAVKNTNATIGVVVVD